MRALYELAVTVSFWLSWNDMEKISIGLQRLQGTIQQMAVSFEIKTTRTSG